MRTSIFHGTVSGLLYRQGRVWCSIHFFQQDRVRFSVRTRPSIRTVSGFVFILIAFKCSVLIHIPAPFKILFSILSLLPLLPPLLPLSPLPLPALSFCGFLRGAIVLGLIAFNGGDLTTSC